MKKKDRYIDHAIAVQTAWKEGKQIEQSLKGKDDWRDKYTPFDWAVYDYRVKPEYKTIEDGAENYITQIEELYRRSAQIINPSTDFTEIKKIWTESDVWEAYVAGARMQKARMIEKAYQWICESITIYVTCNEEDGYIIDYDEMHEDFFKEMEE